MEIDGNRWKLMDINWMDINWMNIRWKQMKINGYRWKWTVYMEMDENRQKQMEIEGI